MFNEVDDFELNLWNWCK